MRTGVYVQSHDLTSFAASIFFVCLLNFSLVFYFYHACMSFSSLYIPQHSTHRSRFPVSLQGVRRVVCVDSSTRHVEGIITLRDVASFLLGMV